MPCSPSLSSVAAPESGELFFDYDLPPDLIAQSAVEPRDHARLLMVEPGDPPRLTHSRFDALPTWLSAGDLLVLNETRVTPARLVGVRSRTGGRFECLVLGEEPPADGKRVWRALAKTRGYADIGEAFATETGVTLTLVGRTPEKHWLLTPSGLEPGESLAASLAKFGEPPLPPYINKGRAKVGDRERYQTVYARTPGSVAAPTAGLHFTPQLLDKLKGMGVGAAFVTLHVGLGTFASVESDPAEHPMHAEWCEVPAGVVELARQTREAGKRVVAVGTTSARALESAAPLGSYCGPTSLFIRPGYEFQLVSGLVTNFHLPRTTLLLLVQALVGTAATRLAYEAAIAAGYRFYSYGDAMLVRP